MAAASFFGHALLGLGPGIAFFLIIIAPKSLVVLLSLFSAFFWLVVMLFTSGVFRGFVPIAATQPAYAGTLLAAVAIEEAARVGVWQLHKRTVAVLHRMSHSSGHTFTAVDELYLAVGWGYGQAATHALIMFASLLPLTAGHGTLYTATCPQMSVFLTSALHSLGMGATLIALSVVALDAWSRGATWLKAFAPVMHSGAALLTLGTFRPGGCVTAVAAQLALGVVNSWYAASIAWRRASSPGGSTRSGVRSRWRGGSAAVAASQRGTGPAHFETRTAAAAASRPPLAAWTAVGTGLQGGGVAASGGCAAAGQEQHTGSHDSPPPKRVAAAVAGTLVSPRLSADTAGLRSRGGIQQGQGL